MPVISAKNHRHRQATYPNWGISLHIIAARYLTKAGNIDDGGWQIAGSFEPVRALVSAEIRKNTDFLQRGIKTMRTFKFMTGVLLVVACCFPYESAFAQNKLKDKVIDPTYTGVVWPSYAGEKIGIAILAFEDGLTGKAEANWINADSGIQVNYGLGDGLSNMLVSTMMSTNRFKIVDKKIARRLFELYSNDTATKIFGGAPALPKVPGIKYFILGSLTALDDGSSGVEGGIGFGGVKLTGGKSTASLTIHMRIIDATNGLVVYSAPVEGTASVSKAGISIDGVGNLSGFKAAPIGQAIQKMLDKATDDIIIKSFPGTPSIFPPVIEEGSSK